MLSLIFTIIMFAVLLVGLLKKWNATTWMLLVSLVFGLAWQFITGSSLLGEAGTGNYLVDVFEIIQNSAISQFTSVVLCIACCMGYIGYIDQIKANAMFTNTITRPLKAMNKPYVVLTIAFVISALVKFVIPAPASVMALLLATLYPIMNAVGISPLSASVAILMGAGIPWGPSNSFLYTAFSNAGLDTAQVTTWALTTQMKFAIPTIIAGCIIIPLSSVLFDRKEKNKGGENISIQEQDLTGQEQDLTSVPKIYAILPMLPLLILLFFTFVLKVAISLVASLFMSQILAMIIWTICSKEKFNLVTVLSRCTPMYAEAGKFFAGTGFLLITSNVFATVIGKVGGLNYIVEVATQANMSPQILILVVLVIVMAMVAMTSATIGMLPVFAPLFMSIATATSADPYLLIGVLIMTASICGPMGLVYMGNVVVAPALDLKMTSLVKRCAIPCITMSLVCCVVGMLSKYIKPSCS